MPKAGYDLLKARKYDTLIAQLVDRLGMERTATTWLNAEAWLDLLLGSAPEMSDGERQHVEGVILPTCAIYFAMGAAIGKDEAFELLRDFMRGHAEGQASRMGGLLSIPGARHLAMMVLGMMAPRFFGASAGFDSTVIESTPSRLRMEVRDCTYQRWCEICGAPELAPLFCDNDDYAYGSIKGLDFRREGTLARGAEVCDFDLKLR